MGVNVSPHLPISDDYRGEFSDWGGFFLIGGSGGSTFIGEPDVFLVKRFFVGGLFGTVGERVLRFRATTLNGTDSSASIGSAAGI